MLELELKESAKQSSLESVHTSYLRGLSSLFTGLDLVFTRSRLRILDS